MPNPFFLDLIALRGEERNLEYKQSTAWDDKAFRVKIAKSILAMSNIRDGGHIIIGMERQADDTYLPKGMEQSHISSYTYDGVASIVAEYADPYARFSLTREQDEARRTYVWIQVREFDEIPVICRKSYGNILSGGKLYTRTWRRPESAEVPGSVEMREIIDMAIEKSLKAFSQRAARAGMAIPGSSLPSADQAFEEQLRGLL